MGRGGLSVECGKLFAKAVPLFAMSSSSPQSKIKPAEFRCLKVDENHARQKQAISLRVGFAR